jgi:hypothetical protein
MSKCNIKIPFPPSSEQYLAVAESSITGAKGQFSGDKNSGSFTIPMAIGDIVGEYTIADEVISIDIIKKPIIVTCHMIEHRLKGYLEAPPVA